MRTAVESEVNDIRKCLLKMIDGGKNLDELPSLLSALENMDITVDILMKTSIGKIVNDMRRKIENEGLTKRMKTLIKKWKSLSDVSGKKAPSTPNNERSSSVKPITTKPVVTYTPVSIKPHADEYRNKVVGMFIAALKIDELPEGTLDVDSLAVEIEQAHYDAYNGTDDKYKSAIRSKIFNVRDKKNPNLRNNILTGVIEPKQFAVFTSEDMQSDSMKKLREQFTQEAINEHQIAVAEAGDANGIHKCGKCKSKLVNYFQMQTRSADEGMTIFYNCQKCGNRWKQ
uniref:DNA-directed RNA polymerase I subunit H n=1 Tax=Rhabditophanes sp. KR3021 TaxID=114890 RepID=A0AC35UCE1_9BILA